jgi:urocanate hydratase
LQFDPDASKALSFTCNVLGFYSELISAADTHSPDEPSLGGKLLFVGELDDDGRALVVAGNVAGAASLAATSDLAAQKNAIHDGVVDFLVTSLDEALRILKNEIRKHETVAVCIGVAPDSVEREMLERGVLPDIVRPSGISPAADRGADDALIVWSVSSAPARWLPKLDDIALECLGSGDEVSRRWLRLAPRYLGRMASGTHLVKAHRDFARQFMEKVQRQADDGKFGVPVRVCVSHDSGWEEYDFGAIKLKQP